MMNSVGPSEVKLEKDGGGEMRARISSHSQSLLHLEGDLLKWTNYLGGWQVRHFELKNGVLVYRRAESKGYECSMTVKDATLGEDTINRCRFTLSGSGVMWHLEARTLDERNQWISALLSCNDSGYNSMATDCDSVEAMNLNVGSAGSALRYSASLRQLELHLAQLSASRQLISEKFSSSVPDCDMLIETIQNTENIVQECLNSLSAVEGIKNLSIDSATSARTEESGQGGERVVGDNSLHSVSEEEWHDAEEVANAESAIQMDAQVATPLYLGKLALSKNHVLFNEIEHITMEQLRYGKAGVEDGVWELFASDGDMKMYKRDLEIDGLVCDPLKATHWVKGVSAREYLHYFFGVEYKMDWDGTLDDVKLIEKLSDDTMVLHQVHKRVWPAAQRESLFWSHIRRVDSHKDPDALDAFIVCNHDTERPEVNLTNKACVRVGLTIAMICQTVVERGSVDPSRTYTRDDIGCRIIYVAQVNPGGWVPSSALRVVYKREYPRFLKRFTQYVNGKTKGLALKLGESPAMTLINGRLFSTHKVRKAFFAFCLLSAFICLEEINFAVLANLYKNLYSGTVYRPIRTPRTADVPIAILTVVKDPNIRDYSLAIDSVKCYTTYHGYRNLLVDIAEDEQLRARCNHSDFMFQRHCVTARVGERHPELEWILFIDADMGIVNPNHLIEEFIPEKAEIVFYNRIFNHEIMAGSYLFRNSKYARDFLDYWANYEFSLPNSVHGSDNGAIHNVFLERLCPDLRRDKCQSIWNSSQTYEDLWDYVTCTRWLMGEQSEFDSVRVRLLAKGRNAWSRDGWITNSLWSERDFILHGWQLRKKDTTRFASWPSPFIPSHIFDQSRCSSADARLNWPYKDSFIRTDEEIDRWISATISEVRRDYLTRLKRVLNS